MAFLLLWLFPVNATSLEDVANKHSQEAEAYQNVSASFTKTEQWLDPAMVAIESRDHTPQRRQLDSQTTSAAAKEDISTLLSPDISIVVRHTDFPTPRKACGFGLY